jgi:hypothetical protein
MSYRLPAGTGCGRAESDVTLIIVAVAVAGGLASRATLVDRR